jgi:hypothetical protein
MIKQSFASKTYKDIYKRISSLSFAEIFIFILVATAAIFIVRYFGQRKEWRTIKVEVVRKNWVENYEPYGYRAPFWLSDKIKVGQVEKGKTGKVIAELIDAENYERGGEESLIYLTVKVKTIYYKRTNKYVYNDKYNLELGAPIELNLNNIQIAGQIIDNNVPENNYPTKYVEVLLRTRQLQPWTIDQIKPNDKMYNRANNDVVAEIISTKIEDPSLNIALINGEKYLQILPDTRVKDLIITAKVKCYQEDGKWYFAGHQNMKIGAFLYFYTDKVDINGLEIMSIKELPNQ